MSLRSIKATLANFAFHAEYFHDHHDELIFCEIASRPGGGAVKDAIHSKYGINLVTEWMKCEIKVNYQLLVNLKKSDILTGFLLVPPANGVLQYVPPEIPFDWVKQYRVTASINSEYQGNVRTSGEIISILIDSNDESELLVRINAASLWANENLRWAKA